MRPPADGALLPLQRGLERLYRLDEAPDVVDFVLPADQPIIREELLVRQTRDGVEIRLVLDGRLLLGARNIEDYFLLVEGVSHYLCVVFRARQRRPVTALELELQAEVDKFMTCLAMWRRRRAGPPPQGLARRTLDRFRIAPHLQSALRARYRTAATLARRYCTSLESRYVKSGRLRDLGDELRRFYRMGLDQKRAFIDQHI